MERRLTTILAADLANYSGLMALDEEGVIRRLKSTRAEIVDPAIEAGGGRIVKVMGDGLLVEFASPVNAVRAALTVQRAMSSREAAEPDERRLRFRVGINLGDVAIDGPDLLGDAVNIAARLESLAPPGGICVSRAVHDHTRGRIDAQATALGPQLVKNLPEPVDVWRIEVPGAAATPLAAPQSERASIAVLPFETRAGDPDLEDLAQGLAEEVIGELGRFRWLRVIAYASTRRLTTLDMSLDDVAGRLKVRYALQGSVRRSGTRLRVSAALADAVSGVQVWANRFDRPLDDVFELQDAIASAIVTAVAPELGAHERTIASRRPTENLDAWGLYQRALMEMARGYHGAARLALIESLAEQAITADPDFAAPHALIARLAHSRAIGGWTDDVEATVRHGIACGEKAVALDPRDEFGYAALAFVLGFMQDYPRALQVADRGVALNPNNPAVFLSRAVARFYTPPDLVEDLGPHGDAIAGDARAALEVSPLDPGRWSFLYMEGLGLALRGRPGDTEAALEALHRAAREPNRAWQVHGDCALILAASDRMDEARAALVDAESRHPNLTIGDFERVHRSSRSDSIFKRGIARLSDLGSTCNR